MVQASSGVSVSRTAVQTWMLKVLQRKGMFAAEAEIVALRLLEAEQQGRGAWGLALLPELVSAMDLGDIDPRARTLTVLDLPAAAILDGSTGAGQVGATKAMQLAIQKAHTAGIGMVIVKNSQPCGDVRRYAELAAQAGCIGFCTTNSGKAVLPAERPVLSVHPQAWALPAGDAHLVSLQTLDAQEPLLSPAAGARGLLSLVLTAGLTAARAPYQKKKSSPYGAGAEHFCLAIQPTALQAQEPLSTLIGESWPQLQHSVGGWERVSMEAPPERLLLSSAAKAAIDEVAQSTRVPWLEE
jgi:hypothetical protein